ncbi:MAG: glycogen phosphorylase [Verrucomicrobia bacterium]|nr:MAG: glycogen phosphorylase [Verrucomicrobiota bacterium]
MPGGVRGLKFNVERSVSGLKLSIRNHLRYTLARHERNAELRDWWIATSLAVRDRVIERYMKTQDVHQEKNLKRVYYFSMEYLMGRLLSNNLYNIDLYELVRDALKELGMELDILVDEEVDMGLGNGGLGRLAACFLDSLATLNYAAIGYGIHYEFGLFRQEFVNGMQVEHPDNWLKGGSPWQIVRPEYCQTIPLYGRLEQYFSDKGDASYKWVDVKTLIGVPWDIAIAGYGGETINFLRLWESRASEEFDLYVFNKGGYVEAVREKAMGETISKVLYPNDQTEAGKELRLVQQYFFAACSLRDIRRRFKLQNENWDDFPSKAVIQLNDTHPAISIVELMRILIDEEEIEWERAWGICRKVFAYTNHTLLPEALEKWRVSLFEKVLPRHLQIIYQINDRFLYKEVEGRWPGDNEKKKELSIIEEGDPKMVRMAYLAVIGSFSVNGVAQLHTKLIEKKLFHGFYELYPERFNNKTNGITPRRWLGLCNPALTELINRRIGKEWMKDLDKLRELEKYCEEEEFQKEFMLVKKHNKEHLAKLGKVRCGIEANVEAIFDVQIKRIHEYKRQHLNLLHIVTIYYRLLHNPEYDICPRVFIFGGKAAPGYEAAKDIIYMINAVGMVINSDGRIKDKLKVVFVPNYGVTTAMHIIPAADLSEQISLAGTEASGTGNMKLALNGACTIGTLDGANVEIKEEVGDENIFIFGMTVEEVEKKRKEGYNPRVYYENNLERKTVIDWLSSGYFTPDQMNIVDKFIHELLNWDPYMVLADYESYCKKQDEVDKVFKDKKRWAKMAILNTARMGKFSSDRTIKQYANEIWKVEPIIVPF